MSSIWSCLLEATESALIRKTFEVTKGPGVRGIKADLKNLSLSLCWFWNWYVLCVGYCVMDCICIGRGGSWKMDTARKVFDTALASLLALPNVWYHATPSYDVNVVSSRFTFSCWITRSVVTLFIGRCELVLLTKQGMGELMGRLYSDRF